MDKEALRTRFSEGIPHGAKQRRWRLVKLLSLQVFFSGGHEGAHRNLGLCLSADPVSYCPIILVPTPGSWVK